MWKNPTSKFFLVPVEHWPLVTVSLAALGMALHFLLKLVRHLDRGARVRAWLSGRDYTLPEDVRSISHDVLRHRISPSYEASAEGITPNRIIDELLKWVAVP